VVCGLILGSQLNIIIEDVEHIYHTNKSIYRVVGFGVF
jgi:hypothetical protein